MIKSTFSHGSRRTWIVRAAAVFCVFLFYYTYRYCLVPNTIPWRIYSNTPHDAYSKNAPTASLTNMSQAVPDIWRPYIHNLTDTRFTTNEGYHYEISKGAHRWGNMGKRLIIIDVDTRIDDQEGGLLNETPLNKENMSGRTGGVLNHFLYALIHGYDYRLIRAPNYEDRHGTWVKVPIVKEALKTHDFVVFMDADAVIQHPRLPFEWLMSLWNITPHHLLAMSEDPNSEINRDDKGWVLWNTGFIVAQASTRTQELFQRWEDCPVGDRYPECERWARDWAHEQAAFGRFVRYDYNTTDELRAIPCMDGNGADYIGDKKCGGVFVRHHWFEKARTVTELYEGLSEAFVVRLQRWFYENRDKYYLDVGKETYPLDLHI